MSKGGFKIFDADCHVNEPPEKLEEYIEDNLRDALLQWKQPGVRTYRPNQIGLGRRLGSLPGQDDTKPVAVVAHAPRHRRAPLPNTSSDSGERISDMDLEGIDGGMILPTGIGSFCSVGEELELGVIRAYHRYMTDFCISHPERLFGAAVVSGRSIEASVAELKKIAREPWPVAVFPSIPPKMPLDDPRLDPLWKAAADLNMAIALHAFTVLPPYAPGALDGSYFDNHWIARSAAHPWCGQRNMASLLGSKVLDRYPDLTVSVLEAGHGWLPYWVGQLDEQAAYSPNAVPENMRKIRDYVCSGRYFQSIELHEGPTMTKYVIDQLGEDVLMFSTDYPHGETWFPEGVDTFLGWTELSEPLKRKLLWDNAKRCFPRISV